jgi:Skp family chaperone for outer membrane proteins
MKRISLIAACFVFTAIFAATAAAQTQPAAGSGRIGLVNINAFAAETGGITKFKTALTALETEFKPANDKLRGMFTRYQTLGTEIENMRKNANPQVPMKPETVQAKVDEFQKLERDIKREQEDFKANYDRRYGVVIGPVFNDILKAMNEYAKAKGYAVILDGAKLEEASILMGFDDRYDVTKDFIAFYNQRPATAATATK